MKKDLALQLVQDSVSSIFSKEDVINIINGIEVGSSRKITTYDIGRAIDETISWFENNERDVIELGDAEVELNYDNRIEVVGIPLQIDNIREALENNFMDFGEDEIEFPSNEKEVEEIKIATEQENN
jgi:transcriptional/translational regulatory protein YebC/TACO1